MLDFEQAAIQFCHKNSPERIYLVDFPSLINLNENIIELGLKENCEKNHDLALAIKLLPLYTIETKRKIGHSYEMIIQEIQNVYDRNDLEPEILNKLMSCVYTFALLIKKGGAKP